MHKGNSYQNYIKIFCVVCLIFFNPFFISCIFPASLNLDHTKIRLLLKPNETKSSTIEVENPTNQDILVKVYAQDWIYTSSHDGAKDFYPSGTLPRSASRWISFFPNEFILPAISKQKVKYTIKVPSQAEGTYVTVLFFETDIGNQSRQGTEMNIKLRIGSLFYIDVEPLKRDITFNSLSILQDKESLALKLTGIIHNIGNQDITLDGQFHILDKQGMVFCRGEFNRVYTLPGDSHLIEAICHQKLLKGIYDIVMTFDAGKSQEETGFKGGPIIVKEIAIEIDDKGNLISWQASN
ncbi:MAG: DUF916 domain-containing protein [Candidatus Omnitrophica bacterium]|nr:DUF916 domain-containing protein [Candidatus Omnitrophota bacterium]